jgi:hypothetical protein
MAGDRQQVWSDLAAAMRSYRALQDTHHHCLDLGTVPDVEQLAFEQAQAFAALQNAGAAVLRTLSVQPQGYVPAEVCQQLAALIADSALLTRRIQTYRDMVGQRLAQLCQTKKAFLGYGGLATSQRPTYVQTSV